MNTKSLVVEFVGTFALIFIRAGVVAIHTYDRQKEKAGTFTRQPFVWV